MHTEHRLVVQTSRQRLWDFLMNVPVLATCIPGIESVEELSANTYKGRFKVSIGPISAKFDGKVDITETDETTYRASLKASGADSRLASQVNAHMTMLLSELSTSSSEICINTDLTVMGKLGEFGQPILVRKSNDLMKEFSKRLKNRLENPESST